jgi:RNA polymerase sigma-70 factor (ECF subfamily)
MDIDSLVTRCIAQNRAAQHELFTSHRAMVLRLVWRFLGPRDEYEIDEAVQEVFVQLFRSLERFRGDSSFDTWVHRIAANVCTSLMRKRYRWFEKAGERGTDLDSHASQADSPHRRLERLDTARRIYGALDRISRERRVVFVLVDMENKSLEEAAEIVGKPLGTVKSRLFRARKDLAGLLKDLTGEEE